MYVHAHTHPIKIVENSFSNHFIVEYELFIFKREICPQSGILKKIKLVFEMKFFRQLKFMSLNVCILNDIAFKIHDRKIYYSYNCQN